MKKKLLASLELFLVSTTVLSQFTVVSCSAKNNINIEEEKPQEKEEKIISKYQEISKLSNEERIEEKIRQNDLFSNLSIDDINKNLLDTNGINLRDYFVNLNNHHNLKKGDKNYIDPELGILLVKDFLEGDILIKDVMNEFDYYKENNLNEYNQVLSQMNLSDQEIKDSKNLEELTKTTEEDKKIENDFKEIEQTQDEDEIQELDKLFELNSKYKDGDIVYIDFKQDESLFDYENYDSLETQYLLDYDIYFKTPITVTVEMANGTKINIDNFDIHELEFKYGRGNFLWCVGESKLFYRNKEVFHFSEGWWKGGYKSISKMYYSFKKLSNPIDANDNKIFSKVDNDTFVLNLDLKTYNFFNNLEQQISTLFKYYSSTEFLYNCSIALTVVSVVVTTVWLFVSIVSGGAMADKTVASAIQSVILIATTTLTYIELKKTKTDIDKYTNIYNSKEYELLKGLFDFFDISKSTKNFTDIIKIHINAKNIIDSLGQIYNISDLKIVKLVNSYLDKSIYKVLKIDEILNVIETFKNKLLLKGKKLLIKVANKFQERLLVVSSKLWFKKLTLVATAWANPIYFVIDIIDNVISVLQIANDIFLEIESDKHEI